MLDKEAIREAADIAVIAEEIGIPIKYEGSKPQILCPCHNDQHFGSCYLKSNNTFKCYSCGAYGDVFTLVQKALNISFAEAVATVAECCGGTRQFELSDEEKGAVAERNAMLLPMADQEFLGIHSEPVYVEAGWRDLDELEDDEKRNAITVFDSDNMPLGYCVQKKISSNPLLDLLNKDPEAYHDLIDTYCGNKIQKIRNLISIATTPDLLRPARFFGIENPAPEMEPVLTKLYEDARRRVNKILRYLPTQDYVEGLSRLIRKAQDISIRYGAGNAITKNEPADIERLTSLANSIWLEDPLAPF